MDKASKHHNARFTVEDIKTICQLYKKGVELKKEASEYSSVGLAKRYGISRHNILEIVKGNTYKRVDRS